MIKKSILVLMFAGIIAIAIPALAMPEKIVTTVIPSKHGQSVIIPSHAVQMADHVFGLGQAIDPATGDIVEGYAIIHPKNKPAKGGNKNNPGKGGKGNGDSQCYAFLAKGAKWKSVEPWIVNTANNSGLTNDFIFNNFASNISKWETAAVYDVLGDGAITLETLLADTTSPDNKNEVYFDALNPGTIGVTIIWGIFGGPPHQRKLVEWDQVYNNYYQWSDNGEAGKMDFENIATHELGHSVGLGDLYDSNCNTQTMYGYADYGETNKRSLESGDIAGIKALY